MKKQVFGLILLLTVFSCKENTTKESAPEDKIPEYCVDGGDTIAYMISFDIDYVTKNNTRNASLCVYTPTRLVEGETAKARKIAEALNPHSWTTVGTMFFYDSREAAEDDYYAYTSGHHLYIRETPEMIQEKAAAYQKYFDYNTDEFTNVTWVMPIERERIVQFPTIYCYFQLDGTKASNLRMYLRYAGDKWLFFDKVQWKIDDWTCEYVPSNLKKDHSTTVWEWFDDSSSNGELAVIISKIASCNMASYRLVGDSRTETVKLIDVDIASIKRTVELYKIYGGSL